MRRSPLKHSPKLTVILFCSWNYLSSGWRRATTQGKLNAADYVWEQIIANALYWEHYVPVRSDWISVTVTVGQQQIIFSLKAERKGLNNMVTDGKLPASEHGANWSFSEAPSSLMVMGICYLHGCQRLHFGYVKFKAEEYQILHVSNCAKNNNHI